MIIFLSVFVKPRHILCMLVYQANKKDSHFDLVNSSSSYEMKNISIFVHSGTLNLWFFLYVFFICFLQKTMSDIH